MKEFLEVFRYTFRENLRKKAFIISTVIMLIIVIGAMVIPAVISSGTQPSGTSNVPEPGSAVGTGGSGTGKDIVYLVDKSGLFTDKLDQLQAQLPGYDIKIHTEDTGDLKDRIKSGGGIYLIVASIVNDLPSFEYYTNQYGEGPSPETISGAFRNVYSTALLKQANVPDDIINKTLGHINVNVNELGKSKLGGYISSIFMDILLFFAVYFYGYGVSMSVASEKTSRVMELLVTSVKPSRIILGKTAGMGVLGLLQLAVIILAGGLTYSLVFPENFAIGGIGLDFSSFTPLSIAMMIVYFILGYTLYALMNAVVGATVSKAEDINSAMMPMSFIAIIAFYFSYGTFMVPDSTAARIASMIPFTSPFSVPSRMMATRVPFWEIGLSLLILVASIIIIGTISIKLYSFAVLHYGDRLKLGKLLQISRNEK